MNMIIEKQNGACVIDEPWFTGSRDLGELCFKVNFFGSPKSGSPNFYSSMLLYKNIYLS